ncbi:ADP-ribosylation factor-like protein 15 isoform X3 [Triplophysa dalaica]|uniref:ADP-ribosylation factor-like protein 15 isoform X3 n=1 Tax=Triplophysa dalaica TaxID=1582913 RepID=UPI0024DFC0E2|nr:ADP-ribosylation factor-like protein 15 isoform X3 [Triplophysa dalaica]
MHSINRTVSYHSRLNSGFLLSGDNSKKPSRKYMDYLVVLQLMNHKMEGAPNLNLLRCFRTLCCKGPPTPRPEYDVVCIGLTGSGKTSLLSRLCSEAADNIVPTTGADSIKKYWSRYYQGSQGVVFVLDSASSEEDMEVARTELHSALQHPQLCTLPFLILANHQDKPAARSVQEIKKFFELEPLARGKSWILEGSMVENMDAVKESFAQLIHLLEEKDQDIGRI